jgi:CRP/FNR family transcriptional regulator, cyclic AMP receptor protein
MPGKKDYLSHLRKVPLFSACTDKELAKIGKASDEVDVAAGTTFVDQGQTGREAFVILSGSATVRRNGKKVATLGPGAVIGELSLLDHGPRTASVTTDEDSTLLVIDQRHFTAVLDDVPQVSHRILAGLASRVRDLDRRYFG